MKNRPSRGGHPQGEGLLNCSQRSVRTSGAPSPTLGKSIGLGYVPPSLGEVGERIQIVVRGKAIDARVVAAPFVRRGRPNV